MTVYTVHEPPMQAADADPERFRFVRDGFSLWAFLLTPLWMLCHRLWLVFAFYVGVVVGSDLETAERRFFDTWVAPRATVTPIPPPAMRIPPSSPEVLGLFPEPEQRR